MTEMKVWDKLPRRLVPAGATIVDTIWLDNNKAGPGMTPDVRSRMVAREFATELRDDLFVGTPCLEAIKMLISIVASSGGGRIPKKKLMAMDVKRAFLHAPMTRDLLPTQDPQVFQPVLRPSQPVNRAPLTDRQKKMLRKPK